MLTITKATPKDIHDLRAMIKQLCAFHGDPCHMGLAETQKRFIEGPLLALMAHQAGQAVGFAALETHWRPMDHGDGLDIAQLFVVEPMRGHGIGHALIKAAQAHARDVGASRLTIGTSPINPGAAAAYRAMGLHEITSTPGPRFRIDIAAT